MAIFEITASYDKKFSLVVHKVPASFTWVRIYIKFRRKFATFVTLAKSKSGSGLHDITYFLSTVRCFYTFTASLSLQFNEIVIEARFSFLFFVCI